MGVRMALGTTLACLQVVLLRQGLITIAAGTIRDVAGAVISGLLMEGLVEGAKSVDATTCAAFVLLSP
jgi:hypothetical protein